MDSEHPLVEDVIDLEREPEQERIWLKTQRYERILEISALVMLAFMAVVLMIASLFIRLEEYESEDIWRIVDAGDMV